MIWYFIAGLILMVLDRVTKAWALKACVIKVVLMPCVSCSLAFNRGFGWSLFHSTDHNVFVIVSAVVFLVLLLLTMHAYYRWLEGALIWPELLIVTGAISNFIDRIMYGGVVDFIELSYKNFYWPSFNVADVLIVCGVAWMALEVMRT